jgi:hypothetical protein
MEYSSVQLNDLPDEILMIIFKKLDNTELLYSLAGLNMRLNRIIYDSIFTNYLTFLRFAPSNLITLRASLMHFIYPLPDPILDRFCLHILPKIHQKVKWLDLEPLSMERILFATNYSNLSGIALYNIEVETAGQLFSGKIFDFDSSTDKYIKSIYQTLDFIHIYHMNKKKTVIKEIVLHRIEMFLEK